MKKIIALLLALCVTLAFVGCASEDSTTTTAAEETTEAATEAATEAETEAATEVAEETTAAVETEVTVMTYEEYAAAELDSAVCVETYVQATQSWWNNTITVYAQSEDGAYFIYSMECSEEDAAKLVAGTKIRVSGYKSEWSGEVEITDAAFEFIDGDSYIAEPEDLTELWGTDELLEHQNEKVTFKGVTVEAYNDAGDAFNYAWDGSGEAGTNSDLYFTVSLNGTSYTFTVESYLCEEGTDVYTAVTELQVGDVIDIEGYLYWYEAAQVHVTAVTAAG